jgi:Tat protein secretion system quality control protein TatD with DNase activity
MQGLELNEEIIEDFSGLNTALYAFLLLCRDIGIRYAQERALVDQMDLISSLGLPLMLYSTAANDALAEKIRAFREREAEGNPLGALGGGAAGLKPPSGSTATRIAVFSFSGTEPELAAFVSLGCWISVGGLAADPEAGQGLRDALRLSLPLNRLLVCSNAPYGTPQVGG